MPLSGSDRVKLIKLIASRLGKENWQLIDVTLNQFGIQTPHSWGEDPEDYILNTIASGTDQSLIELAQHVGHKFEDATPTGIDPPFWRPGMLRLFISHLAVHRTFAGDLQQELLRYGISSFVAHNDIEPSLEWQTQIEMALATCEALIALLHEKFHVSNWTDQEIGFAMGRHVPAFAVRLGETPYGFIGRFQAFNGNGKTLGQLASELFDCFRKNKQTQHRMGQALVALFEGSDTFAEAKERVGYLEQLEVWEPSFSVRIQAAAQSNDQIDGSWGVPARVKALAKKWK